MKGESAKEQKNLITCCKTALEGRGPVGYFSGCCGLVMPRLWELVKDVPRSEADLSVSSLLIG